MAAAAPRRGADRAGRALGGVRADRPAGDRRGRRGARRLLQAGRGRALPRPRRRADPRAAGRRGVRAGLGDAVDGVVRGGARWPLHAARDARPRHRAALARGRDRRSAGPPARRRGHAFGAAGHRARRDPGRRRPGHPVPQPARVRDVRDVPRVWPRVPVSQLLGVADLPPVQRSHALPLLRLRAAGAGSVSVVQGRGHHRPQGPGHREGRRGGRDPVPRRPGRAARSRRGQRRQGRGDPGPRRASRGRHPGRHADGDQGPRLPGRDAGRRAVRRHRAVDARLPGLGADLPAADPGGRARRPRRSGRARHHPDVQARGRRGGRGVAPRLPGVLRRRARDPGRAGLSAPRANRRGPHRRRRRRAGGRRGPAAGRAGGGDHARRRARSTCWAPSRRR